MPHALRDPPGSELRPAKSQALELARSATFALIILDRMLPDLDGLQVCRSLREEGSQVPILMLTAKDTLEDKIDGLKGGADDYLSKPFAFEEVLARIEALLRRSGNDSVPSMLTVGDLRLDLASKAGWRGERQITLTAKEFALLAFLMAKAGTVVTREELLKAVWGLKFDPGTNVVDVYIRYLRRKIDGGQDTPMIQTVKSLRDQITAISPRTDAAFPSA